MGVDVGSAAAKIVQLHKGSHGWTVTAAGIVRMAHQNGRDYRQNSVRAILDCIELSGSTTRLAVCGVGGPDVAVRSFEISFPQPSEIEQAIAAEARRACPFDTDDLRLDYRLFSRSDGKASGYVAAATSRLVSSKLNIIKEAGLRCALVDVEALALINCYSQTMKSDADCSAAILNIGSSFTTFVAESANAQPFVREIRFAGRDIIDRMAGESGIPADQVEASLFDTGLAAEESAGKLREASSPLVTEITKTLRYYESQQGSAPVRELLVCGGFASARGLTDVLSGQLSIKAVLWNPLEKMRVGFARNHNKVLRQNVLRKCGPAMAVAAGLAMRSI